ncbi:MAG: hypothetical protein AB1632_03915 [Nitrospirota bacterium]
MIQSEEAEYFMEAVRELIQRYGLEEDFEHVIIPLHGENGRIRRCYLLKRRFIRIVYPEGHFIDYPLAQVIEAIIRYPEISLSEALYLLHKETDELIPELPENKNDEN